MLKTSHRWPWTALADLLLPLAVRRNFSRFLLTNPLPGWDTGQSLVITPNHFSFWDGLILYFLRKKLLPGHYRNYVMMQRREYDLFRPLRYTGAYPVDPGVARTSRETLRFTAGILDRGDSLVALYPDGRLIPHDEMPHHLTRGISLLPAFTDKPFQILPVFFRITFWNRFKPEIWCRFGPVLTSEWIRCHFKEYEDLFNENLAQLDRDMRTRTALTDLFTGRKLPD